MIKKVAVLNGHIEHIYHDDNDDFIIENATIEEREMEYSEEYGWREAGISLPPSEVELLKEELSNTNAMLLDMMELLLGGM